MGAVWMRVRTDARKRWLSWIGLALVLGLVGGAGIAAAAGARRTETAYPRFVDKHAAFDVMLGGFGTDDLALKERIIRSIIDRPEVIGYVRSTLTVAFRVTSLPSRKTFSFPEIIVGGPRGGDDYDRVNTPNVIQGRMYDAQALDEAVVDFTVADRLGLRVGQELEFPLQNPEAGPSDPLRGKELIRTVRIVGIVAVPWDLPAVGQSSLGGVEVTPAFIRTYAGYIDQNEDAPNVRLRRGAADIPSFVSFLASQPSSIDIPATLPQHLAGVRKTLGFEVSALWLLAGLIGLAALTIVGQTLGRQAVLDSDDFATLRAMAMSPGQLFAVGMFRAGAIGGLAALVAASVALLGSPLFPRGLAKIVEPTPGYSADWFVIAIGAAGTLTIAMLASIIPAWRVARARSSDSDDRGSPFARRLAAAGGSPTIAAGVRLALEPGRGRRALPVRSTIFGIAVALAAFWAAAMFTQSLDHLIATPSLHGYAWDAITTASSEQALAEAVRSDPDVVAAAEGGAVNVVIQGEHLIPFTYGQGGISPVIVQGRAPRTEDEIALGTRALRAFHKRVGDSIDVVIDDSNPDVKKRALPYRIVGTTVVPPFFFKQVAPGFGSAMTLEGYYRLDPNARGSNGEEGLPYVIRYRNGVDVHAKLEALRVKLGGIFTLQVREPGAELAGVSRSSSLPYTLTEILLFMAAATLTHALVTAVRKRRHDLAILKTLGFSRRQIRWAVAWQATTFVVSALAIGLPLGTAIGHWAWAWFVDTVGLVRFTITPPPIVIVIVVVSTLILANAIAFLPGRSAARTKPALVLRSE
jgi:hypothetical protein